MGSSAIQTMSFELIGDLRRIVGFSRSHRRASIDLAAEAQRDRLPATARSRSPSKVTIRLTVEVLPDGTTRIWSPAQPLPLTMSPEIPKVEIGPVDPLDQHPE